MLTTRYQNGNTGTNETTLIGIINDPACSSVTLFCSPSVPTAEFSEADSTENNLPLVAALAKYSIPRIDDLYIVFDGMFLTAARRPRFLEVSRVLDAAEASGKVWFATNPVPFTSALTPEQAVETMLSEQSTVQLETSTRAQYFALLCGIPEAQYP
ncbi:hypothetical protein LJR189_004675 [Acidovorax delafieldii]|uniref:hypothetical protein n=1 Tax=Acidovorax delafieldii TaxID=47920 RepID=UPI003ECC4FD1